MTEEKMPEKTTLPAVGAKILGGPVWGQVVAVDEAKGTYKVRDRAGCEWRIGADGKAKKMATSGEGGG